ncbi:hypothetical protein AB0D66_18270 [Streptomyces sp. NPDC048270]|uniref:hypothetical protein n=1 Tax=Streptomyces sp. NPDC048270 TaxID=3154615 RepID=UPI00340EEC38
MRDPLYFVNATITKGSHIVKRTKRGCPGFGGAVGREITFDPDGYSAAASLAADLVGDKAAISAAG